MYIIQAYIIYSVQGCNTTNYVQDGETTKMCAIDPLLPEWEDKECNIFQHSSKLYFYLPFKKVNEDDIIEIDCKYIESMHVVQGYYYLNIPFTFCDRNAMTSMFDKKTMKMKMKTIVKMRTRTINNKVNISANVVIIILNEFE